MKLKKNSLMIRFHFSRKASLSSVLLLTVISFIIQSVLKVTSCSNTMMLISIESSGVVYIIVLCVEFLEILSRCFNALDVIRLITINALKKIRSLD